MMKKEVLYLLIAIALCSIVYADPLATANSTIGIGLTINITGNCTQSGPFYSSWSSGSCGTRSIIYYNYTGLCSNTHVTTESHTCPSSGGSSGSSSHSSSHSSTYQYCGNKICGLNSYCLNNVCVSLGSSNNTANKNVTPIKPAVINNTPVKPVCAVCETCTVCATCPEVVKLDNGLYCNNDEDCKSGYCKGVALKDPAGLLSRNNHQCSDKPAESKPMSTNSILFYMGLLLLALILAIYLLYKNSDKKPVELTPDQESLYKYFKENKDEFRIKDLKQAAIQNGSSKQDVKMALKRMKQDG
jgi:hypothetical protein